jgi:protein-disulfide isomerase-like protein with CxxC motif
VIEGLRAGADWDVTFVPFSLHQMHVEDGDPDVWDTPAGDSGLLALEVGTLVRDLAPERFLDVHEALFDARHVHGQDLRDRTVLRNILESHGVDAGRILGEAETTGLETVHKEHDAAVADSSVWGVPTFIAGAEAVFVRLMDPPEGDAELAQRTIDRVLDLLTGWPELNEFKHTSIPR